ncbi:unnamed protein product [Brugia timori]|uniref:Secreted protein n=1 Tax=Brugia timori TaxID=42155 RepID=A0A0R3QSK0_9BILA|nr:unnamed protein product [Brugia timori]
MHFVQDILMWYNSPKTQHYNSGEVLLWTYYFAFNVIFHFRNSCHFVVLVIDDFAISTCIARETLCLLCNKRRFCQRYCITHPRHCNAVISRIRTGKC